MLAHLLQHAGHVMRAVRTNAAKSRGDQEGRNRSSKCRVSDARLRGRNEEDASWERGANKKAAIRVCVCGRNGACPRGAVGVSGWQAQRKLRASGTPVARTPPRRPPRPPAPHSSSSASSFLKPVRCSRLFCPMMCSMVGVSTTSFGSCSRQGRQPQVLGQSQRARAVAECWFGKKGGVRHA